MAKRNSYAELLRRQQEEINAFPCFFAFNESQLKVGMEKLGVSSKDELYAGLGGMLYRKADSEKLRDLLERHGYELSEALKDDSFLLAAFKYEMANREYCVSYEASEVVEPLGFTVEEVDKDARLSKIFSKAEKEYMDAVERSSFSR